MSKQYKKIILSVMVLVILFIIGILIKNKKIKKNGSSNIVNLNISEILYDNETELYYIKNKVTNEIDAASHDKTELEFYLENPNYNPNPMQYRPRTLEEYQSQEREAYMNSVNQ